jgi:hypothetical protein
MEAKECDAKKKWKQRPEGSSNAPAKIVSVVV